LVKVISLAENFLSYIMFMKILHSAHVKLRLFSNLHKKTFTENNKIVTAMGGVQRTLLTTAASHTVHCQE
jgi:hypothetical protein